MASAGDAERGRGVTVAYMTAPIRCLLCSRELGRVERRDGRVRYVAPPTLPSTAMVQANASGALNCTRCGGRALVGPPERYPSYYDAELV